MPRNPELDALKSKEQDAFKRKQDAFSKYSEAKARASEAHDVMQLAWERRTAARTEMNAEYDSLQRSSETYQAVWGDYTKLRDRNNARIDALHREAESEHSRMKDCFERASNAYELGRKSEAPGFSAEAREHKARRDALNAEVSAMVQEIHSAKINAELHAPRTDSSAFKRAKEVFMEAKAEHERAEAEFKRLKTERDRLKSVFDAAQAEHLRLKEEFQRKLNEIKTSAQHERDETLDKAGVRWSEREDAKIIKKSDGTTQIYHGGIGSGDGLGHGHVALDQYGDKTYDRDAFSAHGSQNFVKNNDGSISFDWHGRPAKAYPNQKDPEHFTDILYDGAGGNVKGDGHGHMIVENATGRVVGHRAPGEKEFLFSEDCPGINEKKKTNH